jgi:hypothetical protein
LCSGHFSKFRCVKCMGMHFGKREITEHEA